MTQYAAAAESVHSPVVTEVTGAVSGRRAVHATGLALGSAFMADGVGVVLLALADERSRSGVSGGYLLFWAGLAAIFLPSAWVLLLPQRSREVRLAVALGFGLALYLAKVVYEPTMFTFHDEFAHYRNAANLLASGQLFGYNPLIRATGYYPGLAVATDALVRLTGWSIYTCGLILIGCARLTLVAALFLLIDELVGSPRAGGIAVLVYAANPNFLYWDAQYAYESIALPLAVLAVYFLARRRGQHPAGLAIASASAAALAVVPTHHITALALAAVFAVWAAAGALSRRRARAMTTYVPVFPAAVIASTTTVWLAAVAPITVSYLGPVLSRAVGQGIQLIVDHHTSRTLFANTGQAAAAPAWEEAAAIGGTLVILAVLPIALYRVRRTDLPLIAKLLAFSSVAWVVLIPLRFTSGGQETANRSSEFVYVGIALCFGFLLDSLLGSARWPRISAGWRQLFALGIVALLFAGGTAVSWNFSQRLAPDYRLTNGSAVVTPDDDALARWMLAALGPAHRVATDPLTGLALGSVGRQDVLSSAEDGARVWQIFYPPAVDGEVLAQLRQSRVQYVVVQLDVLDLSPGSARFDDSEPATDSDAPLPATALSKFGQSPVFREIYAAGSLRVYQVVGSAGGPR
jgi:hypothetical protein